MARVIRNAFMAAAMLALAGPGMAQDAPPTQEGPDQWRASKLVGVAIYGPGNTSVGKVSDLLMGRDGRVRDVVVGIGGLLGIGEKDVAIPFDQVTFSDQSIQPPAATAPAVRDDAVANGSTAGGTVPARDDPGSGAASSAAPAATDVLGAPSHSAAYPEHGTITMTIAQLRAAPSFHYAQ